MAIHEVPNDNPIGTYVWITEQGEIVTDGEGNYMCIFSARGDRDKIKLLADAARHYGIEGGRPEFLAGSRPVSNDEFERQKFRQQLGLTPDEYDLNEYWEDYKNGRRSR